MLNEILGVIKELTIYIAIKAVVLYLLWNYILVWQFGLPVMKFSGAIAVATVISTLFFSRMQSLTLASVNDVLDINIASYKNARTTQILRQMAADAELQDNEEGNGDE